VKGAGESLGYVPALDGLRAISIAMVVGYHSPLHDAFFFSRGDSGVDVFFVLSGYLISSLLLDERAQSGTIRLRDFYLRRFLRIVPVFWVFAFVLAIAGTEAPGALPWVLTYTSNVGLAFGYMAVQGGAPITWSLSMEEQFYAAWPPLARRFGRRALLGGVVVAIAAASLWRLVLVWRGLTGFPELTCRPDARMDMILWGCLAALVEREERFPAIRAWVVAWRRPLIVGLVAAGAVSHRLSEVEPTWLGRAGYLVQGALTAAVILWVRACPASRVTRLLAAWPLVWVGKLSYSIYLWHLGVAHFVLNPLFGKVGPMLPAATPSWARGTLAAATWAAAVVAGGLVSYFAIERPFLRLKSRFARVALAPASGSDNPRPGL
jgi:peptidoglycan/LPS O-acetylase OafA/YrhL